MDVLSGEGTLLPVLDNHPEPVKLLDAANELVVFRDNQLYVLDLNNTLPPVQIATEYEHVIVSPDSRPSICGRGTVSSLWGLSHEQQMAAICPDVK